METDTRDRVIALERDVRHLEKMQLDMHEHQERVELSNTKQHASISTDLTEIKHSVNGGLDLRINKAIAKYMPKQLNRGLTFSDKVQQAIVSGFFVALAAWAGAGFPRPW